MPCWRNVKRSSGAFSAVLLLAACGEPAQPPAENAPAAPAAAPSAPGDPVVTPGPSLASPLRWEASSSGEGNAIVLFENDAEILRIACLRANQLRVQSPRFRFVESEERMSVGAGDVVVTLVATGSSAGNPPVRGEGAIDPDFIRAVGEGRKIAVNYGYQNIGPFQGPPEERARNFQSGCEGGGG